MGLIKELLKVLTEDEKKQKKEEYTDQELEDYGLTEWEKEEVKKGNQDPWNYEEDDKEDDDYYNEDDD